MVLEQWHWSVIGFVGAIKDDERRADAVRRLVLNEAYFNLGLLGVIDARCVARKTRDRNRLILRLRSDSRTAHDLFSVEKGTASRIRDRIWVSALARPFAEFRTLGLRPVRAERPSAWA